MMSMGRDSIGIFFLGYWNKVNLVIIVALGEDMLPTPLFRYQTGCPDPKLV